MKAGCRGQHEGGGCGFQRCGGAWRAREGATFRGLDYPCRCSGTPHLCVYPTPAETKLYNNVTVFVPGYETPYAKLDYQYLTRNPFVKQMERERYFRVVTVAEQPSQPWRWSSAPPTLWTLAKCGCRTM